MALWCIRRNKTASDWYSLPQHVIDIELAILEYEHEIRAKKSIFDNV